MSCIKCGNENCDHTDSACNHDYGHVAKVVGIKATTVSMISILMTKIIRNTNAKTQMDYTVLWLLTIS